MLKNLFKISTSLLTIPCCVVFPLAISSCKKPVGPTPPPPRPVRPVIITEPDDTTQEVEIKQDGTAQVVFVGFKYSGITDQSKLHVDGTFKHDQTEFTYLVDSFDPYQKTFGIFIDIKNATPAKDLTGVFTFTYDDKQVFPEKQATFHLSINEHKQIIFPDDKESESQIKDGSVTIKFYGFECKGITDIEHLTILFSGKPVLGECTSCEPINYRSGNFDIAITFENVKAETVMGSFQFYYDSTLVDAPSDNFYCVLEKETGLPDFEEDSWEEVIWYASWGLSNLQEHYGIASFVGLKKSVTVLDNDPEILNRYTYPVTVIGQNHDHFKSGNPVPLSFQFDNVSCHHVGDIEGGERIYDPYKISYADDRDQSYWYNPEDGSQCNVRKYLNETLLPLLDIAITPDIKPVMKETLCNDEEIVKSRDTLWTLSPTEMGYSLDGVVEGECYPYYLRCKDEKESELRTAKNLVIYDTQEAEKQVWWTRSPFIICDDDGRMSTHDIEAGLRIGFCI